MSVNERFILLTPETLTNQHFSQNKTADFFRKVILFRIEHCIHKQEFITLTSRTATTHRKALENDIWLLKILKMLKIINFRFFI